MAGGSAECVKVSALINKPALCLGCNLKNMRAASAKNYIYTRPCAFNKGGVCVIASSPFIPISPSFFHMCSCANVFNMIICQFMLWRRGEGGGRA